MNCCAVIPAGGSGKRMGADRPKQFLELNSKPILLHILEKFQNHEKIDSIVVSISDDWKEYLIDLCQEFKITKLKEITSNGIERQDSVFNAINSEIVKKSDIVLIHDAVRPFFSNNLIDRVIENTITHGAAIPAIKPKETIKLSNIQEFVTQTLDREFIRLVQTPQGFWQELLHVAYQSSMNNQYYGTDDAALIEHYGHFVKIIEGEQNNIKITDKSDLALAELMMRIK
ncbi:MAG: 2-C-methyl-D-erythritol 4-phosphate cytidylyltransferase [Candidatus Kapabacteria bacterium]|nr:2-C-methyl-D-erythritol 4-phosphate cytidylyltransferase [Candidatus Kapabacteria bacterium]